MNGTTERKLSNGSSEHSSSRAPTAESKSTKSNEIADMQKKMKVLKDALLKERQEKENINKAKKDMEKELERTKTQFQEKETFVLKLRDEVSDLQTKLQIEKKKNDTQQAQTQAQKAPVPGQESQFSDMLTSSISSSISGLGGMFGIKKPGGAATAGASNEEMEKLKNDYNYSKKQLEVMKEKLAKAEGTIEQLRKEGKSQGENSQQKFQDLEKELETRIQAYREIHQKYEQLDTATAGLKKDKERIEGEMKRLRTENEALMNERDELEKEHNEKSKVIDELNEVCQNMERELSKQVENVGKLKRQVEEAELKMQIYDLKKAGKMMMDTPAQIMMRKNVNGEYIIELENAGERLTLYPQAIQSFGPDKESEDKFYFDYKNHRGEVQRDVYQGEDRKKVLKSLKTFVKLAESNQANIDSKDKVGTKDNKNLISQMVSFFGN